ncbi:MAG: hypothetical protein ACK4SY_07570 [Pyrobaculum sp.]
MSVRRRRGKGKRENVDRSEEVRRRLGELAAAARVAHSALTGGWKESVPPAVLNATARLVDKYTGWWRVVLGNLVKRLEEAYKDPTLYTNVEYVDRLVGDVMSGIDIIRRNIQGITQVPVYRLLRMWRGISKAIWEGVKRYHAENTAKAMRKLEKHFDVLARQMEMLDRDMAAADEILGATLPQIKRAIGDIIKSLERGDDGQRARWRLSKKFAVLYHKADVTSKMLAAMRQIYTHMERLSEAAAKLRAYKHNGRQEA